MINLKTIPRSAVSLVLSLLGVGGVGLTSWLSVRCHDKAKEKTTKKDKIIAYAPAIISGVGTAGCILGSHHVSKKEIAALTASCTYFAANRDKIIKKVSDTFGREESKKILQEVAQEPTEIQMGLRNHKISIEDTGYGKDIFLDCYSGRVFRSSYYDVVRGIKELNHEYTNGTSVCYNRLFSLWNICTTAMGDQFGWPCTEEYYGINFDSSIDKLPEEPIRFDIVQVEDDDLGIMYSIILDQDWLPQEGWDIY